MVTLPEVFVTVLGVRLSLKEFEGLYSLLPLP